jgi:glycosyltransferase involved in cell wall biosynthesis
MPRVLLLVTDLQRGGTPLRIVRTARALPASGVEPVVGCLAPRGPLSADLEAAGIETFSCDAAHRLDARAILRLVQEVRRTKPDLIHATLFHANLAARLIGRLDRTCPIVTASATIELERPLHRVGEALTHGWSDWHIANSNAVARHLHDELGFAPERLVVIPNPVDVDAIAAASPVRRQSVGLPTDRPMIFWAGRMDRVKRLDVLIDALDLLRATMTFSLVLAGDGPERPRIEARIADRPWSRDVHALGWVPDLAAWLKAADVVAVPSLTEGMPNVVLEAMAAGRCVVAADIPACRELIENGRTGLIVESATAAALSNALGDALRSPDTRARLGTAAASFVRERFALGAIVSELSGFYVRIIEGRSTG